MPTAYVEAVLHIGYSGIYQKKDTAINVITWLNAKDPT